VGLPFYVEGAGLLVQPRFHIIEGQHIADTFGSRSPLMETRA
jgi:hypothetical protein